MREKEYIELDAAKNLLERYGAEGDALTLIDSIKADDVATVVLCRDCKYWRKDSGKCTASVWNESADYCPNTHEDAFCSYGERKEGAD